MTKEKLIKLVEELTRRVEELEGNTSSTSAKDLVAQYRRTGDTSIFRRGRQ